MKIRNLDLGHEPVILAPMEDVTDQPFRKLCKHWGADLMYTEFISADAVVRDIDSTLRKTIIAPEERPVGIQIYGKEIEPMVEAARRVAEIGPDVLDINFGCPVKKIASKGAGAGMLRDVPKMVAMTKAIVDAVGDKVPVTVKTRLGWDESSKFVVDTAERLQDVGIEAITIHGRTRAQMYTGEADWTLIGEVKNNPRMHIPVVGNGDIVSGPQAREYFNRYGVDGIMIGRASIGHPWIFEEVKHYLRTGEELPAITIREQTKRLANQLDDTLAWIGDERRAILHIRRHLAVSFKGLANFRQLKIRLLRADTIAEVKTCLDEIANEYGI
ncbi:MAG: tRNA dihydrouridine synthase DusB [Bacteroidales bacterium]|nr:tRNA dihydrouridine synthase DusB [Bacteroidales bacterium]MCR5696273.1 tRNA dihydrouridine synthase DusB [Marinilabiliaceae bacterium]